MCACMCVYVCGIYIYIVCVCVHIYEWCHETNCSTWGADGGIHSKALWEKKEQANRTMWLRRQLLEGQNSVPEPMPGSSQLPIATVVKRPDALIPLGYHTHLSITSYTTHSLGFGGGRSCGKQLQLSILRLFESLCLQGYTLPPPNLRPLRTRNWLEGVGALGDGSCLGRHPRENGKL